MRNWVTDLESLTENGNSIKEVFLSAMVNEGHISKEQEEKMNQYCVVVADKGFFGKFWDKLWGKDDKKPRIIVVKII